mmetsp:Transcript_4625/g.8189  ORF Transcript_4625/g.8189 Transcript_4625/m.8189 type:complete len:387 (+) Transcript_4625:114-1274(+)
MEGLLSEPIELIRVQRSGSSGFRCTVAETQGRRAEHEDSHAMSCVGKTASFWVLDGHRGEGVAKLGALALVQAVGKSVESGELPSDPQIEEGFVAVDQELQDRYMKTQSKRHDSGSTVVGALIVQEKDLSYSIKLMNCGDSRGVVVRGPAEEESTAARVLVHLPQHLKSYEYVEAFSAGGASWLPDWPAVVESIDHKPHHPTEKARIEAAGGKVIGGRVARVDGHLSTSRGLGDFKFKGDSTRPVGEQKISCVPDIYEVTGVQPGSLLILGCDGLWDVMSSEKAAAFVRARLQREPEADLGDVATALIRASLRKGSRDNVTVMLVQFSDGSAWENAQDEMQGFEKLQQQRNIDEQIRGQYLGFLDRCAFPAEPHVCPESNRWLLNP